MEEFPGGIDWFSLTPAGTLVVSANRALVGMDGVTGKVLWRNEKFGGIDKDNFAMVAGSPYVAIVSGGLLNRQQTILNGFDGSVITDTRDLGVKYVSKRYPVPNQNGFLVAAMSDNQPSIFMIDNNTSKVAWKMDKVFEKQQEHLISRPFNISENVFFVATDKRIYKINSGTGTVEATQELKTPMESLVCERTEDEGINESTRANEEKPTALDKASKITKRFGGLGMVGTVVNTAKTVENVSEKLNMKGEANLASMAVSGKFFKVANDNNIYYFNNKYFVGIDQNTGKFLYEPFKFDDDIATFIPHAEGAIFATNKKNLNSII